MIPRVVLFDVLWLLVVILLTAVLPDREYRRWHRTLYTLMVYIVVEIYFHKVMEAGVARILGGIR